MVGLEQAVGTQHPQFDREDHRREVDCGDTRLFDYWEWVVHQLEADEPPVEDVIATQDGRKLVTVKSTLRQEVERRAKDGEWVNVTL